MWQKLLLDIQKTQNLQISTFSFLRIIAYILNSLTGHFKRFLPWFYCNEIKRSNLNKAHVCCCFVSLHPLINANMPFICAYSYLPFHKSALMSYMHLVKWNFMTPFVLILLQHLECTQSLWIDYTGSHRWYNMYNKCSEIDDTTSVFEINSYLPLRQI